MTTWRPIIERAAYTCFSKSGGLDFKLKRGDLLALAREVAERHDLAIPPDAAFHVLVPVEIGSHTVAVKVEEWTG